MPKYSKTDTLDGSANRYEITRHKTPFLRLRASLWRINQWTLRATRRKSSAKFGQGGIREGSPDTDWRANIFFTVTKTEICIFSQLFCRNDMRV